MSFFFTENKTNPPIDCLTHQPHTSVLHLPQQHLHLEPHEREVEVQQCAGVLVLRARRARQRARRPQELDERAQLREQLRTNEAAVPQTCRELALYRGGVITSQ